MTVTHVERTADPTVLRWVCHDPALADAPRGGRSLPAGSPLGALVAEGAVAEVAVADGDLLVRAADPADWPGLAPRVQAVVAELDADDLAAVADAPLVATEATGGPATVAEVQAIVDAAAGAVAAAHGGRIEVVAVEADRVQVRLDGACQGCAGAPDTLGRSVEVALHRSHPELALDVE